MTRPLHRYVDDYKRYDLYVDVVSIFETLFTQSPLASTVRHFERYPCVTAPDGDDATPDFSVVFEDGTGLAGEIASLANVKQSADKTCRQLLRYDSLTELPVNTSGHTAPVEHVDVLFLTPTEDCVEVAERILQQCMQDPEHPYKPANAPLIVQFVLSQNRTPSKYVIQKVANSANGALREGSREPAIGERLGRTSMPVEIGTFAANKVERAFMNDPIDPVYLATHLWMRVLPDPFVGERPEDGVIITTEQDLAEELQQRHRRGSKRDVRKALQHLQQARLAAYDESEDRWTVLWRPLRSREGQHDTARQLAERIVNPPKKEVAAWTRDAPPDPQLKLL